MKKFLTGGMALAMLAIPSVASADVQRCEASVPTSTVIKTATFTVTQPAGEVGNWSRLWTHDYTVTVNPEDDTFAGVGNVYLPGGAEAFAEVVTGSFNDDGTVSLRATRAAGEPTVFEYSLDHAKTGDLSLTAPINTGTSIPEVSWTIEMKVSVPDIKTGTTTTPGTESVKNHGQFVKAQGGGKTAAQACAGMPLNSTQGGSILK